MTIPDSFSRQENDEVQAELAVDINYILEDESFRDDAVLLDDLSFNMLSYTASIISKIISVNRKQRDFF